MTHAVGPASAIPPVLEDDDDDVAWALQTAQVQWSRRAYGDALSWLERAVDNAEEVGAIERAQQLKVFAASLTQHMWDKSAEAVPARRASVADTEVLDSLDDDIELDEEDREGPHEGSEAAPSVSHVAGEPEQVGSAREEVEEFEEADVLESSAEKVEETEAAEPPEVRDSEPGAENYDYAHVPSFAAEAEPDSLRLPSPREVSQPVNASFGIPLASFSGEVAPDYIGEAPDALAEATSPDGTSPEPTSPDATSPADLNPGEPDAEGGEAAIGGILLVEVRGLQDLPDDAQRRLVTRARIVELGPDEEVDDFGAALILQGTVYIMPTLADAACASASTADVVFGTGSLTPGIPIRVVGAEAGTKVAIFGREDLRREMAECPWVEEDLRQVADHYQALAGAGMGVMGERLDDALRGMITSRCEVQHYGPNEVVVAQGQPVEALYIVGAGSLVLVGEDGAVQSEAHPGDFVFAPQIMRAGPAPATAQAGSEGILLLRTDRRTAHELLLSVPPLLEILAGI